MHTYSTILYQNFTSSTYTVLSTSHGLRLVLSRQAFCNLGNKVTQSCYAVGNKLKLLGIRAL